MVEQNTHERMSEIKNLLDVYFKQHGNENLRGYAHKLCERIEKEESLSVARGKAEIWATAIVYLIARLNFLFDQHNENFLTTESICEFFGTKKTTIRNKAHHIEKACKIEIGEEGLCDPKISDSLKFVQLENGFIVPQSRMNIKGHEIVIGVASEEETKEIERFEEEQRRLHEQREREKRKQRAEINRKLTEEKRRKEKEHQPFLFDDE